MTEQDNRTNPLQRKEDLLTQKNNPTPAIQQTIQEEPKKSTESTDKELLLFIKKQTKLIDDQRIALEKQNETINDLKEEVKNLKEDQQVAFSTFTQLEKTIEQNENISIGKISESYNKSKIDPSDILKEEVVFSAFGIGIGFGSYIKNHVEVESPYGMIMFKYQGTDVNLSGDQKHFCIYRTRSKKELEFIRNHPGYGRLFSENLNYTLSTDQQKHIRMAQVYSQMMALGNDQIIAMAEYYGIQNHGELHKLREQLASVRMKELDEQEENKANSFIKEQEKFALLRKEVGA